MARFFQKLDSSEGSRAPEFLSDHPSPGNRVKAVQAEAGTIPRRSYGADSGRFNQIQRLVT
jgi:predicted Zn-dependent protease